MVSTTPTTSSPAGQLGSLQGARLPRAVTVPRAGPPQRPLQAAVSSAPCSARAAELPPGERKRGPTTLPRGVTAPAHRGRWASRTPPGSNSCARTHAGLSSALFSVSRADLMLSIPPTQTRSLLPASASHPRLQRHRLARGPIYSSLPMSEVGSQRLTQGCLPPRCARIPAVTTLAQPHPRAACPPGLSLPICKVGRWDPTLTPELSDRSGRTLGREVLETVEGGGFAKPRHPAAPPPPPAGLFLLCLLPPLPRRPLDFREGSFLKSPGCSPHPTPSQQLPL